MKEAEKLSVDINQISLNTVTYKTDFIGAKFSIPMITYFMIMIGYKIAVNKNDESSTSNNSDVSYNQSHESFACCFTYLPFFYPFC